jgi:hypothetical protein
MAPKRVTSNIATNTNTMIAKERAKNPHPVPTDIMGQLETDEKR